MGPYNYLKGRFETAFLMLAMACFVFALLTSCQENSKQGDVVETQQDTSNTIQSKPPEWTDNAVFYSLDVFDLTVESSIGLIALLENLSQMGIDAVVIDPRLEMEMSDPLKMSAHIASLAQKQGMKALLVLDEEFLDNNSSLPHEDGNSWDGLILKADGVKSEKRFFSVIDKRQFPLLLVDRELGLHNVGPWDGARNRAWEKIIRGIGSEENIGFEKVLQGIWSEPNGPGYDYCDVPSSTVDRENIPKELRTRAAQTLAVLSFTAMNAPFLRMGQETDAFIDESREIDWSDTPYSGFFKRLISLRHENQSMMSGPKGGKTQLVSTETSEGIAYAREADGETVLALLNLSQNQAQVSIDSKDIVGYYEELFTGDELDLDSTYTELLEPWSYRVYEIRY